MDRGQVYKYGVVPPRSNSDDLRKFFERAANKKILDDYLKLLVKVEETISAAEANGVETTGLMLELETSRKLLETKLNNFRKRKKPDFVAVYAVIMPRNSGTSK